MKQFCRWMVKHGRATATRSIILKPLNVRIDRRHDRRALSVDEVKSCSTRRCERAAWRMSGPERRLLYLLALETGLRANELEASPCFLPPRVRLADRHRRRRLQQTPQQDTLPLRRRSWPNSRHTCEQDARPPAFNVPQRDAVNVYQGGSSARPGSCTATRRAALSTSMPCATRSSPTLPGRECIRSRRKALARHSDDHADDGPLLAHADRRTG